MWFDDTFHPDSKQYKEAFSTEEQQILNSFNSFLESRVDKLPQILAEMHGNPQWNEIVKEAKRVIEEIKWQGGVGEGGS